MSLVWMISLRRFNTNRVKTVRTLAYFSQRRLLASEPPTKKSIVVRDGQTDVSTRVVETVKETTKTATYSVVILAGVGITGLLFYAVFRELFSSSSPNSIYSQATDRCCSDPRVMDALGVPIKAFGEETSRRRRRYVSHLKYVKDGVEHMRMVFYLKGTRNSATVNLEVKQNELGELVYRYLFVQLDDYTRRVIILEDNRMADSRAPFLKPNEESDSFQLGDLLK